MSLSTDPLDLKQLDANALDHLDEDQLQRLLGGVKIPPRPELLMALQEEKYKEEPSLSRIAKLIGQDVGLTAAVLKCVNSPVFGLSSKLLSAPHAVTFMGLKGTFNLTTALLLKQTFEDDPGLHRFWDSSSEIARLGSYLARQLGNANADEMYLLGLFHDSAIPLMIRQLPGYRQLWGSRRGNGPQLVQQEERRYQTGHPVIGYLMAREWGLPQTVRHAILDHHRADWILDDSKQTPEPHHSLLANLKLAEHMEGLINELVDGEWPHIREQVQGSLGLSDLDLDDLIADMQEMLLDQDD
ncbi:MAG: HDOD domain-containing protein [Gammaproteobacteria bacterium SHHR-1]|uniref:HDOD domain-containing protein n=1 Tax=Magnetovirga frankeli TaxID=947516 RepID=UPI001293C8B2|nr:HDOD domain-containing protein [gamma proteobacterium SS-5]